MWEKLFCQTQVAEMDEILVHYCLIKGTIFSPYDMEHTVELEVLRTFSHLDDTPVIPSKHNGLY